MVNYIVSRIEQAYDSSPEEGVAKYSAFFVKTKLYKRLRADVDAKLTADGYEDAIVTEQHNTLL